MNIQQRITDGTISYDFESRGTAYTVIPESNGTFQVWSERLSTCFGLQLKIMTRKELQARAKIFGDFLTLIGSEAQAV